MAVEALLLQELHIAEGAIVEDDDHDRQVVLHGGGEFLHLVHEAAVARDRDDRAAGHGRLRAERGSVAPAEIVLIARREKGARRIGREGEAARKADLRDLVDENAVVRQRAANCAHE